MEENIKILKDLKNKWELNAFGDMVNVLSLNEIKAIENVLNRLEQLENETLLISPYYVSQNYIPKSIIRDKITERQFELQQEYEDFENDIKLNILKEILGEE